MFLINYYRIIVIPFQKVEFTDILIIGKMYIVIHNKNSTYQRKFPAHLFRIGLGNSEECACDDQSVADIVFACKH